MNNIYDELDHRNSEPLEPERAKGAGVHDVANAVLRDHEFVETAAGVLYRYNGAWWEECTKETLAALIYRADPKAVSSHSRREVAALIRARCHCELDLEAEQVGLAVSMLYPPVQLLLTRHALSGTRPDWVPGARHCLDPANGWRRDGMAVDSGEPESGFRYWVRIMECDVPTAVIAAHETTPRVLPGRIHMRAPWLRFVPSGGVGVDATLRNGALAAALVGLRVHAADIQDRDGAPSVIASIRRLYPWLRHLFADGGYAGDKLKDALADLGMWTIEIIKRPAPGYPRPRHLGGVGLRRHSESLRPVGPS